MAKSETKATVSWAGDLTFIGRGGSNHGVVIDGGTNDGGLGIGSTPMELLLMGSGGCASIDIVLILKKTRQKIRDCQVDITGTRNDDHPRVFNAIHMTFTVAGQNLSDKQVARAVDLSMEKYCSASLTLAKACDMTWSYEIVEAD